MDIFPIDPYPGDCWDDEASRLLGLAVGNGGHNFRDVCEWLNPEDLPRLSQVHPIFRDSVRQLEEEVRPILTVQRLQHLRVLAPNVRDSGLRLREWASLFATEKMFWAEMFW